MRSSASLITITLIVVSGLLTDVAVVSLLPDDTCIQTCLIKVGGKLPSKKSINAYIDFLKNYEDQLSGIHLYSLARPSEQNITVEIERLTQIELNQIADKIRVLNLPVHAFI